ncbi:MAG: hypothetical protein ACRYFX_14780 [Janthinobacterium lividum]
MSYYLARFVVFADNCQLPLVKQLTDSTAGTYQTKPQQSSPSSGAARWGFVWVYG